VIQATVLEEGQCENIERDGGETVVVEFEFREGDVERDVLESGICELLFGQITLLCVLPRRERVDRRVRVTPVVAHHSVFDFHRQSASESVCVLCGFWCKEGTTVWHAVCVFFVVLLVCLCPRLSFFF
jgi:hypothetical protein